tara:strand:+ start:1328 stop:1999 length:672 start_codon:yes stop_codon:yes gene_type:complete
MALSKIDISKMTTGTTPVTQGGTGLTSGTTDQFLKFTGTTTLASAADNAGSFVKLSTVDISGTPTEVAFNNSIITSTYKQYLFVFTDVVTTGDNTYLKMQESTNNGGGFLANDCDYINQIQYNTQGNTEYLQASDQNVTDAVLTNNNLGNGSNEGVSGEIWFSRNAALPSKANWRLVATNNSYVYVWSGAFYRDDNGTTNYVRFQMQGTSFASGRITCYGITT